MSYSKSSWADILYSMSGGFLMVAIGILYLIFEKKLLRKSMLPGDSTEPAENGLSRSLIGAQVSCCECEPHTRC
jgi:phosphatidylinositol glycan class N